MDSCEISADDSLSRSTRRHRSADRAGWVRLHHRRGRLAQPGPGRVARFGVPGSLLDQSARRGRCELFCPATWDNVSSITFAFAVRTAASPADASLVDPNEVRGGLTNGAYQLQIRLQEDDVFAGTQFRFSDVRFAVNGVQMLAVRTTARFLADEFEKQSPNDTIGNAQRLGLYETLYDDSTVGQRAWARCSIPPPDSRLPD